MKKKRRRRAAALTNNKIKKYVISALALAKRAYKEKKRNKEQTRR